MDMEQHGVYVIECRENQRRYVGGTITSFKKRYKNHVSNLTHGKHHSPALQADWSVYGADAFTFRILEIIDDKDLIPDREVYWMMESMLPSAMAARARLESRPPGARQ